MQRFKSWQLFAVCVLAWGTTWYAILYQVDVAAPEIGVACRFGLAGSMVLAWCGWRGLPLRFTPRECGWIALQGAFMYSLSYLCVYHAESRLPSGLVAVGYSASPLVNGLGALALFGLALTRRFVVGGVLGLCGVALIYAPQWNVSGGASVVAGAIFTVGAVLLSSAGNLTAMRNRALPFWPVLGLGMLTSALLSLLFAVVTGAPLAVPGLLAAPRWWAALAYLALAGSVLAFACHLTLIQRLGPARSSAVGVLVPLLALAISVAFEGLRPGWSTLTGAALAVAGNVLMLAPRLRRGRTQTAPVV